MFRHQGGLKFIVVFFVICIAIMLPVFAKEFIIPINNTKINTTNATNSTNQTLNVSIPLNLTNLTNSTNITNFVNLTNQTANLSINSSTNTTNNSINASVNVSINATLNQTLPSNITNMTNSTNATNTSINISINQTVNLTNSTTNVTLNISLNETFNDTVIPIVKNQTINLTNQTIVYNGTNVSNISFAKTGIAGTPVKNTYIYLGAQMLATKSDDAPSQTMYYIQDHLGSNLLVVNGSVKHSDDAYYAFGEEKASTVDLKNNSYKFTGKEKDPESGLYYYGARYYEPNTGRFLQADALKGSVSEPLTLNRYSYVRNNPLKYIDPTGNADTPPPAVQCDNTVPCDATYVKTQAPLKPPTPATLSQGSNKVEHPGDNFLNPGYAGIGDLTQDPVWMMVHINGMDEPVKSGIGGSVSTKASSTTQLAGEVEGMVYSDGSASGSISIKAAPEMKVKGYDVGFDGKVIGVEATKDKNGKVDVGVQKPDWSVSLFGAGVYGKTVGDSLHTQGVTIPVGNIGGAPAAIKLETVTNSNNLWFPWSPSTGRPVTIPKKDLK